MTMPMAFSVPITTPATIQIIPNLYTSIYNVGETRVYINFITTVGANRLDDNILLPPGGYLPNVKLAVSDFSALSDPVAGRILLTQDIRPMELAKMDFSNGTYSDDFDVTATADTVFNAYTYAAFVALGGKRVTSIELEGLLNDVYVTWDGTTPSRVGPVGHRLNVGDIIHVPVDIYTNIQFTNVTPGSNGEIRGVAVGV